MSTDLTKFKALVLYVIWKAGDVRDFGIVKLNKVLWFSDARNFEAYGKPLTGEKYIRRKFGPVPKHIDEVLSQLSDEGHVQSWTERYFEFEVKRFSTDRPPDTTLFSADELALIDFWIGQIADHYTATSISEKSHDYGWKIVADGEELPLMSFLAKRIRHPKQGAELDWAQSSALKIEPR
jgi:uncharacterized phage-associated protein